MKPISPLLAGILLLFTQEKLLSQSCSQSIQQISYDTVVTGIGSTEDPYVFSFPQFNSTQGTLLSVNIRAVLSLTYQYDIENKLSTAQNHRIRLSRYDDIESDALISPISSELTAPQHPGWYNNSLAGADALAGSGADFRSISSFHIRNNDTIINEDIAHTAPFMGTGQVEFRYATAMYRTTNPVSGASITNDGATDEIRFVVTYVYCSNLILASDITSFTASRKDRQVDIRWSNVQEQTGRRYTLEKSTDGVSFSPVEQFDAQPQPNQQAQYAFRYLPENGEQGRLQFRIRQTDADGTVKYSTLRTVDLGEQAAGSGIRLSPNPAPAGQTNIIFPASLPGSWQVNVFTLTGQLIARTHYNNTLSGKLAVEKTLSLGTYIVTALHQNTATRFTTQLQVR